MGQKGSTHHTPYGSMQPIMACVLMCFTCLLSPSSDTLHITYLQICGTSSRSLLHALETKQPTKGQKCQKNSLCASRILLPEFTFSKTQNIFTNFRLSYFKGDRIFENFCQSALLEKVDFETCSKDLTLVSESEIDFSGFRGSDENWSSPFCPVRGQAGTIEGKAIPNWS